MPWHRENKAEQGLDGPCHNQTQSFPTLGEGGKGGGRKAPPHSRHVQTLPPRMAAHFTPSH